MQNKNAIILFTIVFSLACLFELSFTWITAGVESDALEYAKKTVSANELRIKEKAAGDEKLAKVLSEDLEKESLKNYLDSMQYEVVFNLGLKSYTYNDCKEREINLGLDLRGGMNVTLEVSVPDVVKAFASNPSDENFVKAIALAKERQKESQEDFITLFGVAFKEVAPNARLAPLFRGGDLHEMIKKEATNEEVLAVLSKQAMDVVDNSYEVLKRRIDKFGVAQPNVQKTSVTGRIVVELPGIKDPERVKGLLQSAAKLEFWETFSAAELSQSITDADAQIAKLMKAEKNATEKKTTTIQDSVTTQSSADTVSSSIKNDSTNLVKKDDSLKKSDSLDLNLANVEDTSTEDTLEDKKEEENYSIFTLLQPNVAQTDQGLRWIDGPVLGRVYSAKIGDTAKINYYLNHPEVRKNFPSQVKFVWSKKETIRSAEGGMSNQSFISLVALKVPKGNDKAPLDGGAVTNAYVDYGQNSTVPEVVMVMNSEGATTWKNLTAANIKRSIAIVMDDIAYSWPTVQAEIGGGRSTITGVDEAEGKVLVSILNGGKLKVPAHIVEETVVGPSLGQEAIDAGISSFIIALLVVLLYMIFYYKGAGVAANIALLINLFFVFGVMASLGATLTLAGIAGIVLTIGMAVDANVIINERIREETAAGKGLRLAIVDGYKNAYSSIIDANVTTLLTGIILFIFGTGPVKGFATTLIIGLFTSIFTAIFITRYIFQSRLDKNKEVSFDTPLSRGLFKNINIDWIKKRKTFYVISGVLTVIGIVSLFVNHVKFGVDFQGGRKYQVQFAEVVNQEAIRKAIEVQFVDEEGLKSTSDIKAYGTQGDQIMITTAFMMDREDNAETDSIVLSKLNLGLKTLNTKYEIVASQKVGPTVADDIRQAGSMSVILSLIVVFIYILIRFKRYQFSLGAIVSLAHDTFFVITIFSLLYKVMPFSLEIDQAFIAAILTIMGYSLNDTVIVFDRIRENFGLYKKRDLKDQINGALNSTLSRTINTSLNTFLVLLVLFVLGGDSIKGFVFAMLVGVIVGTYSSLAIATPVMYDTLLKTKKKEEKE